MSGVIDIDSVNNTINIKDWASTGYGVVKFELNLITNSVKVTECCDEFHTNDLGPKDLDVLIQGLTNLRKQLKDVK